MIKIRNLTKIYRTQEQEITALNNVSLDIKKGEIYGIIGLSGAGKSTLVRCINMLERPTSGRIIVDGEEITSLNNKELRTARQKIGMIFQHFNLLSSRNIFDNILFPMEITGAAGSEARARVGELLDLVGLSDRAGSYPSQLSGGQKQRVGIARALANQPAVLLSDEATSALDPRTTHSILQLLKDINKRFSLTILLITHDMNVIKEICHRVAVIHDAEIVEEGDVLEVFSNPQTPTSKSFTSAIMGGDVPEGILGDSSVGTGDNISKLVRISFIGKTAGEPVVSTMIRRFDVEANILYGNIDRVMGTPFGSLTLELIGRSDSIDKAAEYLQSRGLKIEVLKDV
ncbi:MAG: methionine ABC transporter ATP-binding protein [Clostridia bacterium]|nr:methionine ABC transporter ATP-binding protein [Clostridia bacterium]